MKTATHLREIFGRMRLNDQEIVALARAHALGRCHADASGYVGPWTPTPTTFNNLYFSLLVNLKWEPNVVNEHAQFKDPSGKLMMLPSGIAEKVFRRFRQGLSEVGGAWDLRTLSSVVSLFCPSAAANA